MKPEAEINYECQALIARLCMLDAPDGENSLEFREVIHKLMAGLRTGFIQWKSDDRMIHCSFMMDPQIPIKYKEEYMDLIEHEMRYVHAQADHRFLQYMWMTRKRRN